MTLVKESTKAQAMAFALLTICRHSTRQLSFCRMEEPQSLIVIFFKGVEKKGGRGAAGGGAKGKGHQQFQWEMAAPPQSSTEEWLQAPLPGKARPASITRQDRIAEQRRISAEFDKKRLDVANRLEASRLKKVGTTEAAAEAASAKPSAVKVSEQAAAEI